MIKSVVQFHADPNELLQFVNEIARDSGLYISGIWKEHGFKAARRSEYLTNLVAAYGVPGWLFVTEKLPTPGKYRATQDFLRVNRGALSVTIGQLSDDGLDESSIGFLTTDAGTAKRWRAVIDRFKRRTRFGAKTKSIVTGLPGVNKSHRYTAAAQELAWKGVTMWALGRKTVFEFVPGSNVRTGGSRV